MTAFKQYDISGKALEDVSFDQKWLKSEASPQLVKDYIVALRANKRQWSANTKGRSEIAHSNKKPHKQKGTGNARQGSLASPQYRGGGIVFGPKPKFDQHVRINRKERRKAIAAIIAGKVKEGKVHFVDESSLEKAFDKPKTKSVADFLKALSLQNKRVLFLSGKKKNNHFFKSVANLPKAEVALAVNASGYDLAKAAEIVMTQSAFEEVNELLK